MNLTNPLGWTLLHFVWQGSLIAVILAGVLACLRNAEARTRYAVNSAALVLMLLCAAATFVNLQFTAQPSYHSTAAIGGTFVNLGVPAAAYGGSRLSSVAIGDYLPVMVWFWLTGVIALSIRYLVGWTVAAKFARRQTWPAEAVWNEKFFALVKRLRISLPVRLAVSSLAEVPAVVGCLRPVVLMPASAFTGLTAEQIEALLAHELAHVCRHDYLVNLFQTAAETLFFYHPAIWWVSRNIRNERENCCDDVAVEICGSTVAYVRALTEMEQMRQGAPRLAMAATGGSLLKRVQRLLQMDRTANASASTWILNAGIITALVIAGVAATGAAQKTAPASDSDALLETGTALASVPPHPTLIAQNTAMPARPAPQAAPTVEKRESGSWLEEIQAAGYRDVKVDDLIAMKMHGVTGEYIRQLRAAGFQLTADQLVAFRIQGVTVDFVNEMKQAGFSNLKPDDLIAFKIHDVDSVLIRQIQALGYPNLSAEDVIGLRIQGVTPEFIREARSHFKDVTLNQLIQLKQFGILKVP